MIRDIKKCLQTHIRSVLQICHSPLCGQKGIQRIMENNIIILEDENGAEIEFETLDVFEFEDHVFFALAEVIPDDAEEAEDDGVLIMMVDGDINSDDAELVMVEDEDLLQRAFDEFVRRDEEFYNAE